jgi:hypothetical protein
MVDTHIWIFGLNNSSNDRNFCEAFVALIDVVEHFPRFLAFMLEYGSPGSKDLPVLWVNLERF